MLPCCIFGKENKLINDIIKINGKRFMNNGGNWIPLDEIGEHGIERQYWCICNNDGEILELIETRKNSMTAGELIETSFCLVYENCDLHCYEVDYLEFHQAIRDRRDAVRNSRPSSDEYPDYGIPCVWPQDKKFKQNRREIKSQSLRATNILRDKNIKGQWNEKIMKKNTQNIS